jgi:LPPG:FO 2-phospho-L-lactate transferase
MLRDLGHDELIAIGDKDRATHILRTELLRNGMSLTASIRELTSKFGIKAKILPMTDDRVRTMIVTTGGVIHFQEFWVVRKGKAEVEDIFFDGIEDAELTNEVLNVLESEDSVLIGPSNPITSISPILRLGMDRILRNKFVIAISPIVGKKPISGPAAELMCAKGFEVSPLGISECYKDFLDVLIIDEGDECDLEGVDVLKTNIIMKGVKESAELAKFVLEILSLHNTERSQPGNGL